MSFVRRFLNVFRSRALSRDIDRELSFHVSERIDDLVAAGMTPDAARREARRRFGRYVHQAEQTKELDMMVWLETCLADMRYGLRALRKSPVFAATAVLTIAIGIGANTAVFSVLHGLLLRGLPVPSPQQLATVGLRFAEDRPATAMPYWMWEALRERQRAFVDVGAWQLNLLNVEDRDGTLQRHPMAFVSGRAFDVLGLDARIGRLIGPADDVPAGSAEGWPAVLSHAYWRDRFSSDPGVLGATFKVDKAIVIIVGVAPASFHGLWPGLEPKFYLPMRFISVMGDRNVFDSPSVGFFVNAVGRRKPGVSFDEAKAEVSAHAPALIEDLRQRSPASQPLPERTSLELTLARTGLPTSFGRLYSTPLYLMQALVGLVLILCCANVSGLMLSKLHERQPEMAIRSAIGATRARLLRQSLTESFVLALGGAVLGSGLAWYAAGLLPAYFRSPNSQYAMDIRPDYTVLSVTAGLAVLTTLIFGAVPAWRAGHTNAGPSLNVRGGPRQKAGRGFVALQVALALVLVTLAGLLSQSLSRLRTERTGFDVDGVTIQTPPFHLLPQKGDAKLDLYQAMVDRTASVPGVRAVAVTFVTPMTGTQPTARFERPMGAGAAAEETPLTFNFVGPGYFRAIGTALVEGREFERRERRTDVCVVNQAAAGYLFPRQNAVGQYLRSRDTATLPEAVNCRIVGVAADAKYGSLREAPPRTVYFPITPDPRFGNLVFLINAPTKSAAIAAYSEARRELLPTTPLVLFATLREQMDAALGGQRAITAMSTAFGGVALLLSAVGLYGMLSSRVAQQTKEIGVRVALGASRVDIIKMVLFDALRLTMLGAVVGLVLLVAVVPSLRHFFYGVSSFDPMTLGATGALLTLVVLVASLRPARRATSIDPTQAMRGD